MHEIHKLEEARYFLGRMFTEQNNRRNFAFELSAFLGAARSVLQYALEEARAKPGGQSWYEQAVANNPLLKFFKDRRDANIHTTPAKPATTMVPRRAEMLRVDDETMIPYPHTTSEDIHRFAEWATDETVIELSEQYLNALQALVDDGKARHLISG